MPNFDRSLLVLGGARSGKSGHAQAVAEARGGDLVFVATAQAFDDEMTDRIARHIADRGPRWRTIEAPVALADAIRAADGDCTTILVDCLTLWASNLLLGTHDTEVAIAGLVALVPTLEARIIFVANEVGFGIVPDNALARAFRDLAGTLNQRVAGAVDTVDLVVAGLPLRVKGVA